MTSLAEFERSLDRQVQKKVIDFSEAAIKKVVLSTYDFIVRQKFTVGSSGGLGSPVFSGRYSNSHTISLNTIDTSVVPEGVGSPDAPLSRLPLSNAERVMTNFKIGDTIFIANSLDYAAEIEAGTASPLKSPLGVYRIAAEAVKVKFANLGGTL